jgi:HD-GYP domain-containing protein (c-di-GMP phosphodiesterase class II)
LTGEEWQAVKRHPHLSREILRQARPFAVVSEIAGSHHERLDGAGYGRRLKAQEIPLLARILAVANRFQSLLEKRSYRGAATVEQAFAEIRRHAGRAFDVDCVAALEEACEVGATLDLMALSQSLRQATGVSVPVKRAIA